MIASSIYFKCFRPIDCHVNIFFTDRQMKLASRNYKSSSKSDGYLPRRYDDDYDGDEEVNVFSTLYSKVFLILINYI